MEQYLLSANDAKALPCITSGFPGMPFGTTTLMCRAQVEALVVGKCACAVCL
jgi:hypothetical protein